MVGQNVGDFIKARLLAAGAGVEHQNFHWPEPRSAAACTVRTGHGAPQTTRYEFVDTKRSVNLWFSGTASTIRSAMLWSATLKIRSLRAPISGGDRSAAVRDRLRGSASSCHSNCETSANTRPALSSSTLTTESRARHLRARESAYELASCEQLDPASANKISLGADSCIRVLFANGPTAKTG